MFRVAGAELVAEFGVGSCPETPKVLCDGQGTPGRREEVDNDFDSPVGYARCIRLAEELLEADGEDGLAFILEGDAGAGGERQVRGGKLIQSVVLIGAEKRVECGAEVYLLKLRPLKDPSKKWGEPCVCGAEKPLVAHVGPVRTDFPEPFRAVLE
jgi:hypothetical protein